MVVLLRLSAVPPCLAAASAISYVPLQIECSGSGKGTRQTQCFRQNCRYSYGMDPSAAPFTNSEVFLLVVLGPCVNVSVPSCGVGNQHREVELGDMRETLTLQTFLGCRARQPLFLPFWAVFINKNTRLEATKLLCGNVFCRLT